MVVTFWGASDLADESVEDNHHLEFGNVVNIHWLSSLPNVNGIPRYPKWQEVTINMILYTMHPLEVSSSQSEAYL